MKPIQYIFLTLLSLQLNAQETGPYSLWKGLEPGDYNIGFETIEFKDSLRTVKVNDVSRIYPVQISLWFPTTEAWKPEKALAFKEYFYLTSKKNDYADLTKIEKDSSLNIYFNFIKYGLKKDISKSDIAILGNKPTASIPQAIKVEKRFPVIIAGHDGGVWKMSTLCEYLASHGYVVISTGPSSETSRLYNTNPQKPIDHRMQTIDLIVGMLDEFTFVDKSKIGLLGLNGDGIPILLHQMKNQKALAVVNIDGWEGKNNGDKIIRDSPHYSAHKMTVPFMEFHQHENSSNEELHLNSTVFDEFKNIDKFSYVIEDFGHAFLTGNMLAYDGLENDEIVKHHFWFNQILKFFNKYVKNSLSTDDVIIDLGKSGLSKEDFIRYEILLHGD